MTEAERAHAGSVDAPATEPWPHDMLTRIGDGPPGGQAFGELHLAQRMLQDTLVSTALPDEVSADITARLREIAAIVAQHQAPESERRDGLRPDLPGRGMPFMPAYAIDEVADDRLTGRVTFSRFHLGGNGAAHGGSIPLVFDDVLGMVVNYGQDAVARTAYLRTNYRRITPINVELVFEASLDRVEGRKRFASGRLLGPSGDLLVDTDGLFLSLLPGQQ